MERREKGRIDIRIDYILLMFFIKKCLFFYFLYLYLKLQLKWLRVLVIKIREKNICCLKSKVFGVLFY